MGSLIQHLKKEHQTILEALDLLDELGKILYQRAQIEIDDLRALIYLFQSLVENTHHIKEERILFPAMAATGLISTGGPRCTYFMGLRLQDNLSERILNTPPPENPAQVNSKSNSPLSVPLEEHHAGHIALLWIRIELERYAKDSSQGGILAARITDYSRLLRLHIEKEDTCLFQLADRILSPEKQDELLGMASQVVGGADGDKLSMYSELLQRLKNSNLQSIA